MPRRMGKSQGWAAFDLKQRQRNTNNSSDVDQQVPYPPLSTTSSPAQKNDLRGRSFSSVLLPVMDFPALQQDKIPSSVGSSSSRFTPTDHHDTDIVPSAITRLKEIYGWADESLILDVMAAVDNDVNQSSDLLAAMVSSDSVELNKYDKSIKVSKSNDLLLEHECSNNSISSGESSVHIEKLDCLSKGSLNRVNNGLSCDYVKAAAQRNLNLIDWKTVPIEPEWEEDDIYFLHRKEALHMTRAASHHSRAATDAYSRGDHFSAQQLSAKAREEWTAAQRLNAKAAKEILSIRNSKNGQWKLDLHGLHASEAVQALQDRLHILETLVTSDRSLSPKRRNSKITGGILRSASLESLTCDMAMKLDEARSSSLQQRPATLHVITGIGNHSRGQAALPTAVSNFLNENAYRYDDARPGVIVVRPKFRHR